uniref:NR LBD domain-containing protein n=1 Tax=Panagrolaimus superbus TaxID=310955 RepID=A0A914YIX0_9BILA
MLAIFTQVFYSFQSHCDTITLPNGSMPMRCMKEKNRLELECFCRCIEPIERSQITTEEYVLAKAIALCNPAIPELSFNAQKIVEKQREYYANILFKHEQNSYGIEGGAVKYTKIMSAIEAMYHFAQRQREFHNICRMQFLIGADNPWPNTCKLKLFEDSVI